MDPIFSAWIALLAIFGIIVCLHAAMLYLWRYMYLLQREQELYRRAPTRGSSSSDRLNSS